MQAPCGGRHWARRRRSRSSSPHETCSVHRTRSPAVRSPRSDHVGLRRDVEGRTEPHQDPGPVRDGVPGPDRRPVPRRTPSVWLSVGRCRAAPESGEGCRGAPVSSCHSYWNRTAIRSAVNAHRFFAQRVVLLALPLAGQERNDFRAAPHELRSVAPLRVRCVRGSDALRVAGVPGVLGIHAWLDSQGRQESSPERSEAPRTCPGRRGVGRRVEEGGKRTPMAAQPLGRNDRVESVQRRWLVLYHRRFDRLRDGGHGMRDHGPAGGPAHGRRSVRRLHRAPVAAVRCPVDPHVEPLRSGA